MHIRTQCVIAHGTHSNDLRPVGNFWVPRTVFYRARRSGWTALHSAAWNDALFPVVFDMAGPRFTFTAEASSWRALWMIALRHHALPGQRRQRVS